MLVLTDMQRTYLRKIRALSEDQQGNEVFAGLTLEESMRFNFLSESLLGQEHRTQEDVDEYLSLVQKHEHTRNQMLSAEVGAQQNRSERH
ncbi:hypothetical protein PS710_03152 [Pseudomonas fluorescens]|uniref:Uncharacterized protein n=1 Tax=Pseudomonas fluorescens TaxID=294 RepID=A0A5E7CYZ8_PSEFL|nr:hypothetical protein PS710_03152 [Pseudomonas fluorescens]VVQ25830.1 hypothetical protein PS928_06217 [Pseudomonas fluorescens]